MRNEGMYSLAPARWIDSRSALRIAQEDCTGFCTSKTPHPGHLRLT